MARKILLADDSVTAQNMGRKILTDAGYEVVTVNNGSAALKRIAEQKPDLIVLDVYMPGYSGLEVCQRIKENRETARIPILLTVGKLEPFKPEEARRARADAFVVKPFEASELLTALTRLEDKIVPQAEPYKQGRFAKAAASIGEEGNEKDIGWKERLRIPTGSNKDTEPAIDYITTQGKGIPDLPDQAPAPKSKAKTTAKEKVFERPMPTGLPADITPEEIAAITAAAAQLNAKAAPHEPAPPAPQDETSEAPGAPVPPVESAAPESTTVESPQDQATEEAAPITFASAPDLQQQAELPASETLAATPGTSTHPRLSAEPAADASAFEPMSAPSSESMVSASAEDVAASAQTPTSVVESVPEAVTVAEPNPIYEPAPTVNEPAVNLEQAPSTTHSAQPTNAPASDDDDVMAALQTLIPANLGTSATTSSSALGNNANSTGMAGIHASASAGSIGAYSAGPRWIAEEVALERNEATLSLEREMEQAYATAAVGDKPLATAVEVPEVSGPAAAESHAVVASASQSSEADLVEQHAEASQVYAMASAAGVGEGGPVAFSTASVTETAPVETSAPNEIQAEPAVSEPDSSQDAAPALITDTETGSVEAVVTGPGMTESPTNQGAEEEMTANWKNIRDSIAGAAPKRAPAKEDAHDSAQVQPDAGHASATPADNGSHTAQATDPKAIASIVDSVLAELRPKIVEEIAKKLVEPKKE